MVKVLIVEDNQAVRESTRLVLDGAGHEVLEAVSGLRIEETVDTRKPDLVLTDTLMPGRDGVETVMALRRRHPGVRIIAMSGGGNRGNLDLGMAKKLGISVTLTKPFEPKELIDRVTEILAGPSPA
jgi:CheY-like chemotaxis protein